MSPLFFGFVPSSALLTQLQKGSAHKTSAEPLYVMRDQTAFLILDELLHTLLTELATRWSQSEKSEAALKLAAYIKATMTALYQQLLQAVPNQVAKTSIGFFKKTCFKADDAQYRVGIPLDPRLSTNLMHYFDEIRLGHSINPAALSECYKQFAEALVRHFLYDFHRSLALDMQHTKIADRHQSILIQSIHISIEKMISTLNRKELKVLAEYHGSLLQRSRSKALKVRAQAI